MKEASQGDVSTFSHEKGRSCGALHSHKQHVNLAHK